MPVALERKLKSQARRKGYAKERMGTYVYGTLRRLGWRPSRELRGRHKK